MQKITIQVTVIVENNVHEQSIVDGLDRAMQNEHGVYVIDHIRVTDNLSVNKKDY